jgi:hypothetical protein
MQSPQIVLVKEATAEYPRHSEPALLDREWLYAD